MNIGMLWFDNDPNSNLNEKLEKAATYYQNKYNRTPNLCFVHPSMIEKSQVKIGDIELRKSRSVQPNYFWIGIAHEFTR